LIARERAVLKQLRSGHLGSFIPGFVLALFVAPGLSTTPVSAQAEIFPILELVWTIQPSFGQSNGEGRSNVSGVTCIRTNCLVVNDSTRFAQLFTRSGTNIHPGDFVGVTGVLPPGTLAFNPNMEGAANDGRFFYVVTSRGLAGSAAQSDTAFVVARFTSSAAAPPPPVPFSTGPAAAGVEASNRIRVALTAGIAVPGLAGQQIDRTNAEIEGIAVKERAIPRGSETVLHVGLRAPVLGGKAFMLSAPIENVFATSGALDLTVTPLELGNNIGIRDLAAVADGILILAGSGRNVAGRASLFHLDDTTGQLRLLGIIAEPSSRNAEALLVLEENAEFFRFLLMFDGVENGGPLEYLVSR
jgi:hypothetical protein